MLLEPVGFAKSALNMVALNGALVMLFGNTEPNLSGYVCGQLYLFPNGEHGVTKLLIRIGKQLVEEPFLL